jgi:hypothetical protein
VPDDQHSQSRTTAGNCCMRGHQWSCMGIRQLAVPGDIPARSRSESRVQGRLAAAGNIAVQEHGSIPAGWGSSL